MSQHEELINEHTASVLLSVKKQTLAGWRSAGKGPAFIKVGHLVRYRLSDLTVWIEDQRVEPEKKGKSNV